MVSCAHGHCTKNKTVVCVGDDSMYLKATIICRYIFCGFWIVCILLVLIFAILKSVIIELLFYNHKISRYSYISSHNYK